VHRIRGGRSARLLLALVNLAPEDVLIGRDALSPDQTVLDPTLLFPLQRAGGVFASPERMARIPAAFLHTGHGKLYPASRSNQQTDVNNPVLLPTYNFVTIQNEHRIGTGVVE